MNYLSNKTMSHRSSLKDPRLVVGEVNRRLSHFVNTGKLSSGAGSFPHQVYSQLTFEGKPDTSSITFPNQRSYSPVSSPSLNL